MLKTYGSICTAGRSLPNRGFTISVEYIPFCYTLFNLTHLICVSCRRVSGACKLFCANEANVEFTLFFLFNYAQITQLSIRLQCLHVVCAAIYASLVLFIIRIITFRSLWKVRYQKCMSARSHFALENRLIFHQS